MRRGFASIAASGAMVLVVAPVVAQDFPEPRAGFVHDFASVISDDVEAALEADLRAFERDTSNQVAVVTIESLDGADLEAYSLELANRWGIGQAGRDNGVMLLVVERQRRLRLEVGFGLEDELTDDAARRLLDEDVVPALRDGGADAAVRNGVRAIIDATRDDGSGSTTKDVALRIVIVASVLVAMAGLARLRSESGAWLGGVHGRATGGAASGGGGFGGGGFGGGGASGGW